ncbi:MAG: NH(3)-dependent NAD(+) synthetase [Syntrophorhabdaceae bacterium]|nr:NH(3)-dependent NAD(+) synthetase [Syntrophorhabdaceae bacterium]
MTLIENFEIYDYGAISKEIIEFLRDKVNLLNRDGVLLGLSGGLDSTVCAYIAVEALGKDKVFALFMPDRDSNPQSERDAFATSKILGIELREINLSPILSKIGVYSLEPLPLLAPLIPRKIKEKYTIGKYNRLKGIEESTFLRILKNEGDLELRKSVAYYSIKHRLRMVLLYYWAEIKNYAVLGCCNKTEKLTGFFIKHGDSASDIDLISHLYKTQVRELAKFLRIPKKIINKVPSPDLIPGVTDEFALKLSYDVLDKILYGIEKDMKNEEIACIAGTDKETVQYVKEIVKWSEHMRKPPFSI